MSPTSDPVLRLRHIVDEAEQIGRVTEGLSFEIFRDTWMIRRSVPHGLLIITEAARSLPAELKAKHAEVRWRPLESFGNVLRHEYQHVDPWVLWRIVQEEPAAAACQRSADDL